MIDFPTWFAGSVTIVALLGLGIFLYPWLLKQKGGVPAIGATTVLLTFVFYQFDSSRSVPIAVSLALAAVWALAPVVAGVIVWRLSRNSAGSAGSTGSTQTP